MAKILLTRTLGHNQTKSFLIYTLEQVFEIFGPVKTPWYSVRFNDPENIKTKEITVGLSVYCAPKEECFTKYVFVDSLKQ